MRWRRDARVSPCRNRLERNMFTQLAVVGLVDFAHSTMRKKLDHFIAMGEDFARLESRGGRRLGAHLADRGGCGRDRGAVWQCSRVSPASSRIVFGVGQGLGGGYP